MAEPHAVPPAAHENLFTALGGWPTLAGAVVGAVVAIPITFFFTKWGVHYAERLGRERAAIQKAEQRRSELAAQEEHARIFAEKRAHVYWRAAVTLLQRSLFSQLPEEYRSQLIDKIVARFESSTQTTEQLFRTTRLFVERCLLDAAQFDGLQIPAETSAHAIYIKLSPKMDAALKPGTVDPVEFDKCNQLDNLEKSEPKASDYFKALSGIKRSYASAAIRIKDTEHFLTPIVVNEGFVAPMYLVSGLLDRFNGDWHSALSQYNDALGPDPVISVAVRRFEWFRWLLWGTSIPVCTCTRWEGAFTVLQYGYGDESNSFPLILDRDTYSREWQRIREELDRFGERLPLAFGSRFEGTLVWGPGYHVELSDFTNVFSVKSPDQGQPLRLAYERERPRRTVFDGLMLRANALTSMTVRRRYYSAHAWVLFEVVKANGERTYDNAADRWRALFPLFEEANMADGEALVYFKQRLAEKAAKALRDFENDCAGHRRLRYVCAFDDPGTVVVEPDTHEFALTRHPEHAFAPRSRRLAAKPLPVGKNRLRALLANELGDAATIARVFSRAEAPADVITACDLPDIVEAFHRNYLNARLPLV